MNDESNRVGVIGGGAAGISAATWLKSLHVDCLWWAGSASLGGMLHNVNNPIANLPPERWDDGCDLAGALSRQVARAELSPMQAAVGQIRVRDGGFEVLSANESWRVGAVILATGTRYRRLGIPGEVEGMGKWVSQSAARDAHKFDGAPVLVVGGGDAAFENALRLAEAGAIVKLAARSPDFRARNSYVERVRENSAIEVLPVPTIIERLEETETGCVAHGVTKGEAVEYEVACVFVRIGVEPVVPTAPEALARNRRGFIEVDRLGQTSVSGLFAAGDVTSTNLRSVATALGDGARCARSAAEHIGTFFDS